MEKEKATCRGCGMVLIGNDYCYGGAAYHPVTKKRCPVNFYGGFVCSPQCDFNSSMRLENSMPGCGGANFLMSGARQSYESNWR